MNNKLRINSLRLNLTNMHIYKSQLNLNKNHNHLNFIYIEKYIKSVFSSLPLSTKTQKVQKNWYGVKKNTSGTNSPIYLGNTFFYKNYDGIYIRLNYYFDTELTNEHAIIFLRKKIEKMKKTLQKLLNINVFFITKNLYDVYKLIPIIKYKKLFSHNLKKLNKILKINSLSKKTFQKDMSYYNTIYNDYIVFKKSLNFYQKNEYFHKLNKIFFVLFLYKTIDIKLLVNAISVELSKLRTGHLFFFKFLKDMLKRLFKNQKNKQIKIKGLFLVIKGRLILKNRQTPRKKKFLLRVGKIDRMTLNSHIIENNKVSIGRLGTSNIKLLINFDKIKKFNYKNKYNLIGKHTVIKVNSLFKNANFLNNNTYLLKNYFEQRLYIDKNIQNNDNFSITLNFFIKKNLQKNKLKKNDYINYYNIFKNTLNCTNILFKNNEK